MKCKRLEESDKKKGDLGENENVSKIPERRYPKSLCELNSLSSYECEEPMQSTMTKSVRTEA